MLPLVVKWQPHCSHTKAETWKNISVQCHWHMCYPRSQRTIYGGTYLTCHISQSRWISIWKDKIQYYHCTSMLHAWLSETVLIHFQKDFNLLFHEILLQKLMISGLHSSIVPWVWKTSWLAIDNNQAFSGLSFWMEGYSRVPKETKLDLWLFSIMISNQSVGEISLWKYADDTTITEKLLKAHSSKIQQYAVCWQVHTRQSQE